jgi:flavin reductase (DIM6/NTAB) family NADH-FMN oxidoreductase RutF
VTVVTVAAGDRVHGMTASSFASVSLDPPLVLVSLDKASQTRSMIADAGSFAINILGSEERELAQVFSRSGDKTFDSFPHRIGPSGAPHLDGAIAWLECQTREVVDGGDHDVFIAAVLATGAPGGRPLLYYDGAYRQVTDS